MRNTTFASAILLSLLIPTIVHSDAASDIAAHINFACNDQASPGVADCNPGHAACCAVGPEGLFARSTICQKAIAAAKAGQCQAAAAELAVAQCHNPQAAQLILQNSNLTCQILQSH